MRSSPRVYSAFASSIRPKLHDLSTLYSQKQRKKRKEKQADWLVALGGFNEEKLPQDLDRWSSQGCCTNPESG